MYHKIKIFILVFAIFLIPNIASFSKESAEFSNASTSQKIDILAEEIEKLKNQELFGGELEENHEHGFGPAASKVYNTARGLAIGGYGEIVNKSYLAGDNYDQSDAYRGILYVGYKFDDEWSLNTEVEFEHGDESYLEFAYVDYLPKATDGKLGARAGLLLLPFGIINEQHEPILFHGVYRPWVENKLLPTTSRENGVGLFGSLLENKINYKLYYVTSWKYPGAAKAGNTMRNFRGKGSQTVSNEFATIGRVQYNINNKNMIGFSIYDGNINPDSSVANYKVNDARTSVRMISAFTKGEMYGIEYAALYHENRFSHVKRLNDTLSGAANTKFGKKQIGYYYEVAKDIGKYINSSWYIAPFFRYEFLDFHDDVESSAARNVDYQMEYHTTGISIKPIYNIVLKADYTRYTDGGTNGDARLLNLGLGYVF